MNNPYLDEIARSEKPKTGNPYLDELEAKERPKVKGSIGAKPLPGSLNDNAPMNPFGATIREDATGKPVAQPNVMDIRNRKVVESVAMMAPGVPIIGAQAPKVVKASGTPKSPAEALGLPGIAPYQAPKVQQPKPLTRQQIIERDPGKKPGQMARELSKKAQGAPRIVTIPSPVGPIEIETASIGMTARIPNVGEVQAPNQAALKVKIEQAIKDQLALNETQRLSPNVDPFALKDVLPSGQRYMNDRDKYAAIMQDIEGVMGGLVGGLKALNPMNWVTQGAEAAGVQVPDWLKTIQNLGPEVSGRLISGSLTSPAYIGAKMNVLQSDQFSPEEKFETGLGLLLMAATSSATPFGPSVIDDLLKLGKGSAAFDDALKALEEKAGKPIKTEVEKVFAQFQPKELEGYVSPPTLKDAGVPIRAKSKAVKPLTSKLRPELNTVTVGNKEYEAYVAADITRDEAARASIGAGNQDKRLNDFADYLNKHPERTNPKVYVPGKAGWEVVRDEWVGLQPEHYQAQSSRGHKVSVERALQQGNPVPVEVLADYPDLVAKFKKEPKLNTSAAPVQEVNIPPAKVESLSSKVPKAPETPPKATAKPKEEMATVSHADVDKMRDEFGMSERVKSPEKIKQWVEDARQFEGKEGALISRAAKGEHLGQAEEIALGVKLNQLRKEMKVAREANNEQAWGIAFDEAEQIAEALDKAGSNAGRTLRARQVLLSDNFDEFALMQQAKKANQGEPLSSAHVQQIKDLSAKIEAQNAELSAARKEIESLLKKIEAQRVARKAGARTTEVVRNQALTRLKRLLPDIKPELQEIGSGGIKGRQAGVVRIPVPKSTEEKISEDLNKVMRSYVEDGTAGDFDNIMAKLRADTGLKNDQLMYYISKKYKKAKLEADVAKLDADRVMRQIKKDALLREAPLLRRAGSVVLDVLGTGQRALQAGADASIALIQGRRLLYSNPSAWARGVVSGIKAAKGGKDVAHELYARIKNDPWYPRYKQAGGHLSDIDGGYSAQEEYLSSQLLNKLEDKKGWSLLVAPWTKSQHFATAMLNRARFDTWKFLARLDPDNPAYLQDIANQVNLMSGRSVGKVGQLLSKAEVGNVFYAPNYYGANYQYANIPVNLLSSKSGKGAAAKAYTYAANAAWIVGMMKFADLMGWEVDTDIRSTNFGEARIGPYLVDFFGKEADPVKFVAQMIYGRISESGNYSSPVQYGNNTAEMYASNKLAPIPRLGYQLAKGVLEEKPDGGYTKRPLAWRDILSGYLPIAWREVYKGKDIEGSAPQKIGVGIAQLMGAGVQKAKSQTAKKPAPPLEIMPPGMTSKAFETKSK